jgi:hypothetical protein
MEVSNMFARTTRYALIALLAAVATTPSSALAQQAALSQDVRVSQQVAPVSTAGVVAEAASITTVGAAASLLRHAESATTSRFFELVPAAASTSAPAFQDSINKGPNIAMMVVGGAALVVGLAIGGDSGNIIAVGGGVIGLLGLYRYMR